MVKPASYLLAAASLLAQPFNAVATAAPFSLCSTPDYLNIAAVSVTPEPLVPGSAAVFLVRGTAGTDINDGSAVLKAFASGVEVLNETFDLCDQFKICGTQKGQAFSAVIDKLVPADAPKGLTFSVEMTFRDGAGSVLSCFSTTTSVGHSGGVLRNIVTAPDLEEHGPFLFRSWMREHGISFKSAHEQKRRFWVFLANHQRIVSHNADTTKSYTLAHNRFSHLTAEEFSAQYTGLQPPLTGVSMARPPSSEGAMEHDCVTKTATNDQNVPDAVDWVAAGAVVSPKDQAQCGGCWAFSATGAVEGAYFIKTGELLNLSEQELIDCDTESEGCTGGWMVDAFDYIRKNGLSADAGEAVYAHGYQSTQRTCEASKKVNAIAPGFVKGTHELKAGDEEAMKRALAVQPLSVAIEATQRAFQFYKSGVLTGECGTVVDHGVLAVGYGSDNGVDYWKLKNSWGEKWGEHGFIRIMRGVNHCGVANNPMHPIM